MFLMLLITDLQFGQLYRKYNKYAYTVCRNVIKKYYSRYFNPEEINDIIQESFLNVYVYLTRIDEVWNIKSLIARITELTTIKLMDKYVKYISTKIPVPDDHDPIDIVVDNDDFEEIVKNIKKLHPRYSSVILLKNVHSISLKDISEMSGIPYNTILSWHSRGKQLLATRLDQSKNPVDVQ